EGNAKSFPQPGSHNSLPNNGFGGLFHGGLAQPNPTQGVGRILGLPYAGTTMYAAASPNCSAASRWCGLSSTRKSARSRRTSFQRAGSSSQEWDSANHRPRPNDSALSTYRRGLTDHSTSSKRGRRRSSSSAQPGCSCQPTTLGPSIKGTPSVSSRSNAIRRKSRLRWPNGPAQQPRGLRTLPTPRKQTCPRGLLQFLVRRTSADQVFVDLAILHDDDEVPGRVRDQFDVLEGVAIDEQQIGQCAFFHDPQPARIGAALPAQGQKLRVRPGRHDERFGGGVPAFQFD